MDNLEMGTNFLKKAVKENIINQMQGLNTYKPEFETTINIYVDMLVQYQEFTRIFELSGYQVEEAYTNKAGATNMRKTPVYAALEKLRVDLASYSNILCLNPKSLNTMDVVVPAEKSKLESLINEL